LTRSSALAPLGYEEFALPEPEAESVFLFDVNDSACIFEVSCDTAPTRLSPKAVVDDVPSLFLERVEWAGGDADVADFVEVFVLPVSGLSPGSAPRPPEAPWLQFPHALLANAPLALVVAARPGASADVATAASLQEGRHLLCLHFSCASVVQPGPYESVATLKRFVIGKEVTFACDGLGTEEAASSLPVHQMIAADAERFIPRAKRQQWDMIPSLLIVTNFFQYFPEHHMLWLRCPRERTSLLDLSMPNILSYLSGAKSGVPSPPMPLYFDGDVILRNKGTISEVTRKIQSIIQMVDAASAHYLSRLNGRDGKKLCREDRNAEETFMNDAEALSDWCATLPVDGDFSHLKSDEGRRNQPDMVRGYITRLLSLLSLERLRCKRDVQKLHDMYSRRWERVSLRPPMTPVPGCRSCMEKLGMPIYQHTRGGEFQEELCAYHLAVVHSGFREGGKSSLVHLNSDLLLSIFPFILTRLRPEDKLVTELSVPGLAENYPLLSIGDAVRFLFTMKGMGLENEVVGEIIDVNVRAEKITTYLPSPLFTVKNSHGRMNPRVMPYLQALLCNRLSVVDAAALVYQRDIPFHSHVRPWDASRDRHLGMFDLRFGLFGGRGFGIAESTLQESLRKCAILPLELIYLQQDFSKKEKRSSDVISNWFHLKRILAPTNNIVDRSHSRMRPIEKIDSQSQLHYSQRYVAQLNEEQQIAANDIFFARHGNVPYLLYGPPGTGKTLTVVETIKLILTNRKVGHSKILCTAPSDAACDVLARRLMRRLPKSHKILRVNWYSRIPSSLPVDLYSISSVNKEGFFAFPTFMEIESTSVIVCQCFVAGYLKQISGFKMFSFSHVFVDEVSQAMEAETLVPLLNVSSACSIILSGDPQQLGPTIRDHVAARMGLGLSLQERLMALPLYESGKYCITTRLVGNYRSHKALLQVPSNLFYKGSLQCRVSDKVASPYVNFGELGPRENFPLMFYDVSRGKEMNKLDTPSYFNLSEVEATLQIIRALVLIEKVEGGNRLSAGEIAVIAPFRAQVLHVRRALRLNGLGGVNVGVVEDFQGQETKVVVISTVLTRKHKNWNQSSPGEKGEQSLGFMHDPKRFNVAITRAHALCIVVGNLEYLESSGTYWAALVGYIRHNGGMLAGDTRSGLYVEDGTDGPGDGGGNDDYGVSLLMDKVAELNLLGSGELVNRSKLASYYNETRWKVMLT